jgi:hypothetical protein
VAAQGKAGESTAEGQEFATLHDLGYTPVGLRARPLSAQEVQQASLRLQSELDAELARLGRGEHWCVNPTTLLCLL